MRVGGAGNMTERWLICDAPSLLCLSNIGCGAMHLQSASLKPCEQAPIFNLAFCTFGGYRYCLRLNRSVNPPLEAFHCYASAISVAVHSTPKCEFETM